MAVSLLFMEGPVVPYGATAPATASPAGESPCGKPAAPVVSAVATVWTSGVPSQRSLTDLIEA